jgi:hypothetical protein
VVVAASVVTALEVSIDIVAESTMVTLELDEPVSKAVVMDPVPSVMGVPSGAETAGSSMALSLTRWGNAVAKPANRTATITREVNIPDSKIKS